jgi:hypothetical protein
LASRDSFQKRQKEAARREKRQIKLDRRQGRQPSHSDTNSETDVSTNPADPTAATSLIPADSNSSAESVSNTANPPIPADPAVERHANAFKPGSIEPEPPKSDNPPRVP